MKNEAETHSIKLITINSYYIVQW